MKNKLLLMAASALLATASFAQSTPSHPLDIKDVSLSLPSFFDAWTAGTPPRGVSSIDDQFYISRVRPLERIAGDADYQVQSSVDPGRKMLLWVPMDDPSVTWKSLPRYCFEGDNFSLWSYIDTHGNWTAPWFRSTAGIMDVAHKNGVKVGCVWSIPWVAQVNTTATDDNSKKLQKILEKNTDGTFKHSQQLVELMKYYGIDQIGVNSEFYSTPAAMTLWRDFIKDCHKKAAEIGWHFELAWYDGTNNTGGISFDRGLGSHNNQMFGDKDNIVTDQLFFNYNWSASTLSSSVQQAESMGRNPYDVYAGFDIQGNGYKEKNTYTTWQALLNNKVSIGFWGAHAQSLIQQSATDDGTSDIAIQKAYLLKQELTFSGGNRNPALLPALRTDASLSNSDLKTFHGLATYLTAKSTIQQLPFVTRFNLGNGQKFYNEGKVAFDHKWYNINTQDFMPTWRWWITDRQDKVTQAGISNFINAELTFDDAYFGGSCLRLNGATAFSRVKLFKTLLTVAPENTLSLTYKMKTTEATHAKLFVALRGALTDYKEIEIPAATVAGQWTTFSAPLSQLGIKDGDQISMIGLSFDGTPADYEMLVGELAVKDPAQTFDTVEPEIVQLEILRGRYNALDFKIRYQSREERGGVKTYNDEVGTWYYEIYFQQEGQPQYLLTATTSWAAYVIDAPLVPGMEGRRGRFGVRAVSPDGKNGSQIAWTDYRDIPYNQTLTTVVIDKAVVKPGETFTVGLEDIMSPAAKEWKIVDPVTGETLATAANSVNLQTSIAKEGLYDLYFTDSEGNEVITRGYVQVTPESTGAVPVVESLTADKATVKTGEDVQLSYTSRDGEGSVSRALHIYDPNMLMIPGDVQQGKTYSYALWFKADKFSHGRDGTNLINKMSMEDSWPHNNWGDLWVVIRVAIAKGFSNSGETIAKATVDHPANEIAFNTFGWTAHGDPYEKMMSTGYQVTPGVWNHVVVTQQGNNQKMYFNGKKVAEVTAPSGQNGRRDDRSNTPWSSDSRVNVTAEKDAPITIGGGGVYKSGFDGWIDEVQIWNKALTDAEVLQAMKGYEEGSVPTGLQAYYTFEEKEADGTFRNLGHAGAKPARVVTKADTGGESTAGASYQDRNAENDVLGYPGIPGSLEIKTTPTWKLEGGNLVSTADKSAVVAYPAAGKYNARLELSNLWGTATYELPEYIEVTVAEGIDDLFTSASEGSLRAFDLQGRPVTKEQMKEQPGVYVLQYVEDGRVVRSVKVLRR
ncbi:MAG: glycosyl hydrolase family 85 [Bacteroidales bacterium]|nr:glycosyl hydrolase family 85 [Bacteroidales bacterium]